MVKRNIEQNLRIKNFEAGNGNYETSFVVKNQGTKQREQRTLGDCWQWKANGQCRKGDNCSFRHDINKLAKTTQPNPSPSSSTRQNERRRLWQLGRATSSTNRSRKAKLLGTARLNELLRRSRPRCGPSRSWKGLSRTVPQNHHNLAWLVQHAALTTNGHRNGVEKHRPKGARARAFYVWLHHSGRKSCGWRQAKTQVGSVQRVVCVKASSWDSLALVKVRTIAPWEHQMVMRHRLSSSSQTTVLGPRRVYVGENVEIQKHGQTRGCQGCLAIVTENNQSISYNSKCRNLGDQ